MANEVQKQNNQVATVSQEEIISSLVLAGDLSKMNAMQKVEYYNSFCRALQINPITQPFQIIILKGKERMYATKDCTDQLRRINGVSVTDIIPSQVGTSYVIIAKGVDKTGRIDSSTAVLDIKGLQGEALANAMMKCETKAKRRLTLSLCGLGILDETEIESMNPNEHAPTNTPSSTPASAVKTEYALATEEDRDKFIAFIDNPLLKEKIFGGKRDKAPFREAIVKKYEDGTWAKEEAEKVIDYLQREIKWYEDNQPKPADTAQEPSPNQAAETMDPKQQ